MDEGLLSCHLQYPQKRGEIDSQARHSYKNADSFVRVRAKKGNGKDFWNSDPQQLISSLRFWVLAEKAFSVNLNVKYLAAYLIILNLSRLQMGNSWPTYLKKASSMDLDELKRQFAKLMDEQNMRTVPEFEGYSPKDMSAILNDTFGPDSPIEIQKLPDADYQRVPMLNQVKYLCRKIVKAGQIKLTNKGYLPTKIVKELYEQGFIKDKFIASGIYKLYKETDSDSIHLTKILVELSGIAKKRLGKLSLTKAGQKVIQDDFELLKLLIDTFRLKFNWGYFDGYESRQIGPLGFGFTLILLAKYGDKKRLDTFYAKKYFKAFPALLDEVNVSFGTKIENASRCYTLRTFDRFLKYFGLVDIEEEGPILRETTYIQKSAILDKLIKVSPPGGGR